jgi:formamidopyrimidine-DNA glycosylase
MPELPEVETTRRGLEPHLVGRTIVAFTARAPKLRLPLTGDLAVQLAGRRIVEVARRGKYLLVRCDAGTLVIHLGMTGHLRLVPAETPAGRHDHVELLLDNRQLLRLTDPRKFGTVLWTATDPLQHPLLATLGPEPLGAGFGGAYLYAKSRGRRVAVKPFLMDSRVVVGVGNIYASEALFRAGVDPATTAGLLSEATCAGLAEAVRSVLEEAIAQGGTTLNEFLVGEERPGYFRLKLAVYGRAGEPCTACGAAIISSRLGGRSTCWCPVCQR